MIIQEYEFGVSVDYIEEFNDNITQLLCLASLLEYTMDICYVPGSRRLRLLFYGDSKDLHLTMYLSQKCRVEHMDLYAYYPMDNVYYSSNGYKYDFFFAMNKLKELL